MFAGYVKFNFLKVIEIKNNECLRVCVRARAYVKGRE
jgi:hypothetical protein